MSNYASAATTRGQYITLSLGKLDTKTVPAPLKTVVVTARPCLQEYRVSVEEQSFFKHLAQPCLVMTPDRGAQSAPFDEGCGARKCLGGHAFLSALPEVAESDSGEQAGTLPWIITTYKTPSGAFQTPGKKTVLVATYRNIVQEFLKAQCTASSRAADLRKAPPIRASVLIISPLDNNPLDDRHPSKCCYNPAKASKFDCINHFFEMQSAHITLNCLVDLLEEHPDLKQIHITANKQCVFNLYKQALNRLFEHDTFDQIDEEKSRIACRLSTNPEAEMVPLEEFMPDDFPMHQAYVEGIRTIEKASK